mmetsp:Transcript_2678/g.3609  ORF Transcript_2678/g.3609 Transcript_2678/m.3609 type:complete len:384 (+) Transcript_2678:111-1262(+)
MKQQKKQGNRSSIRNRKKKKNLKEESKPEVNNESPQPEKTKHWTEEIVTFIRNCILIACVVSAPYAIMLLYTWYHLQSGITRPIVKLEDTRQMLVFGMQGSGTTQKSKELNQIGAEICHEGSDAMDAFARDGTISWAHAIQALDEKPNLDLLCRRPRPRILHSTQFESSPCSYRVVWDKCWENECKRIFSKNYGCLHRGDCETNFNRYLLQVRHPLHNVASLVVKYCKTANIGDYPHGDVMEILMSFYPGTKWTEMKGGCIEIFSHYWLEYNKRLLPKNNKAVNSFYRVEDTSACKVAELGGFLEKDSLGYVPTVQKVKSECKDKIQLEQVNGSFGDINREHGETNRVNKGKLSITLKDIIDINEELASEVKKFATVLGYDIS